MPATVSAELARFLELELPADRIALEPAARREDARMLVVDRGTGQLDHRRIADLPRFVRAGDLWIANRTRVRPALTWLTKPTGGRVELLWLGELEPGRWRVYGETAKLSLGLELVGDGGLAATVAAVDGREAELDVATPADVEGWLAAHGAMPLPPYIRKRRRRAGRAAVDAGDAERYQTVYAEETGSIAAPTAGLHLTPEILSGIAARRGMVAQVVLHVGPGTFTEVDAASAGTVRVAAETARVPAFTAAALEEAEAAGGRVVAVGTTALRTLEGLLPRGVPATAAAGSVDLTIRPGADLRWAGGLLTNFHLPRTTLRLLVAAVGGTETMHRAYREAVDHGGYRFYSYGDAMLIL